MYDLVIAIGLLLLAAYAACGAIAAYPLHRRGLAVLDPAIRNSGLLFRAGITPGIVIFWPLLVLQWRRAIRKSAPPHAPGAPSFPWQHAVLAVATGTAIVGLVAGLTVQTTPVQPGRGPLWLPGPEAHLTQRGPGPEIGRLFPSMPARFQRARDIRKRPGLIMAAEKGATVPPTSIYWSAELDGPHALPPGAVYVATVWGSEEHWFPFTTPDMWDYGYWIAYSHAHQRIEVFNAGGAQHPS